MATHQIAQAASNELLTLRMQLMQRRLEPQTPQAAPAYDALATRMRDLGDRAGYLIARSFALGAASLGGDVTAALTDYEALRADILRLDDPLEQHVAMGPALYLYQVRGNLVDYMQQACRMLHLANEVAHIGMRAAAITNLGIAFFLAGDELQARTHLEESLASDDLGRWIRFGAVTILCELYAAAGELDKALPLLQVWSFPERPQELDRQALTYFHALGAEVSARLGDLPRTQDYLRYLDALQAEPHSHEARCLVAMAQALHDRGETGAERSRAALADAVACMQRTGTEHLLPSRFWWMAAELAGALEQWEQAFRLLERHRQLTLAKKHDIAAVRRIAAQYQTDARTRAVEAAQRDLLTGLGNRERLVAVGDGWIGRGLAPLVAVLNLRRFNDINEALGRELGDAVLVAVADRLKEACNRFEHAVAGRLYADQFALVVAHVQCEVRAVADLAAGIFATPLPLAGDGVDISAAWGVAHCPAHGSSMHQLMGRAEIALREDRRTEAGLTLYDAGQERADPRYLSLISELQRAARQDEFTLLLQPQIRLADEAVVAFESLIRWNHPVRGRVLPGDFIPFAERTGSIKGITEWVLLKAMQCSGRLRDAGLVSRIAVNISVHDVATSRFLDRLGSLLAATGARAEDIRLELTEGAVMRDPSTVIGLMRDVNALGFEWSIDDFGTGQSSLSYLHTLPVSELKIDRSFVRGAAASPTTLTLLKAAIELGANLGLSTVGEGAETAEDWALLRQLGCVLGQGWFVAHPMPEAELVEWLRARAARQPAA